MPYVAATRICQQTFLLAPQAPVRFSRSSANEQNEYKSSSPALYIVSIRDGDYYAHVI